MSHSALLSLPQWPRVTRYTVWEPGPWVQDALRELTTGREGTSACQAGSAAKRFQSHLGLTAQRRYVNPTLPAVHWVLWFQRVTWTRATHHTSKLMGPSLAVAAPETADFFLSQHNFSRQGMRLCPDWSSGQTEIPAPSAHNSEAAFDGVMFPFSWHKWEQFTLN